jgi:hypothetical protein
LAPGAPDALSAPEVLARPVTVCVEDTAVSYLS